MFKARPTMKYWEQDMYNEGCLLGTGGSAEFSLGFESETLKGLIDQIVDYFGFAATDGDKISTSTWEDDDGYQVESEAQKQQWKEGRLRVWLCDYHWYVVQEIPVEMGDNEFYKKEVQV